MQNIHFLSCAAMLAGASAWAEPVLFTQEEFDRQVVGKTMHAVPLSNARQTFVVQLQEGGRAVVSSSFNDVGRWRPYQVAGYCVLWNKLGPPERCYTVVKVDGKLGTVDTAGNVTSTFELR